MIPSVPPLALIRVFEAWGYEAVHFSDGLVTFNINSIGPDTVFPPIIDTKEELVPLDDFLEQLPKAQIDADQFMAELKNLGYVQD